MKPTVEKVSLILGWHLEDEGALSTCVTFAEDKAQCWLVSCFGELDEVSFVTCQYLGTDSRR